MSILDADHCRAITLWPHEIEDLHWLLGHLEDWLLHTSDEVVEELGEFINHLVPHRASLQLIEMLGFYCASLRRRAEGPDR